MADQEFTLVEAAKMEPEGPNTGFIGIYAEAYQNTFVAPVIPTDRTYPWTVTDDDLPYTGSTGSRLVGSDFDATQTNTKPYSSEVKAYGGKIKVDEYIVDNMPQSVPVQQMGQVKGFARKLFIDTFEGTGTADLKGARTWLGGDLALANAVTDPGYEEQVIRAGTTANGDLLDLDMLDELISKVETTNNTFIYMNDILVRRIKKLNRGRNSDGYNVTYDKSQIGMFDYVYDGIPIISMKDGKNANMLSTTEYDSGGNNQSTMSAYAVTWGTEATTYFSTNAAGVSGTPIPMVADQNDGSNFLYKRFKFYVGLAPQMPRGIARLSYLKNALS